MSSVSSVEALLQKLLSDVPPGENAYLSIEAFLKGTLYPPEPQSFKVQLIFCSVILALDLLVLLAAFVVRLYRRLPIVPFRLITTPRGTLLAPQNLMTSLIFIGIWLFFGQAFIWISIRTAVDGMRLPQGIVLLKCVSWLPLWYSTAFESWAMACVVSLHKNKTNTSRAFYRAPLFINTFFPALIICGSLVIGIFFHFASTAFDVAYSEFLLLDKALLADAKTGESVSLDKLAPLLPPAESLLSHMNTFVDWFRAGWICWAVIIFAPLPVYTPAVVTHLSLLAAQIRGIKKNRGGFPLSPPDTQVSVASAAVVSNSTAPSNVVEGRHGMQLPTWRNPRRRTHASLANAYYRLLVLGGLIFTLTLYYSGLTAFIGVRPSYIVTTSRGVQIQALAGVYPATFPGLLVSIFILMRSLQSPSSHHRSSSAAAGGRNNINHPHGSQDWAHNPRGEKPSGLRIAIPQETIHIKSGGSPKTTYDGDPMLDDFAVFVNMVNTSPTSTMQVQVPVLPHHMLGSETSSPASSSPAASPTSMRTGLPRTSSLARAYVPPHFR